jgi:cell division protein FtsA
MRTPGKQPVDGTNIIGIEIGTSKIAAVVARVENGQPVMCDYCTLPFEASRWHDKDQVEKRLTRAFRTILRKLIPKVCPNPPVAVIGISGPCLGEHVFGSVAHNAPVSEIAMQQAITKATTAVTIPKNWSLLDAEVECFVVDGQDRISDPFGLTDDRLGARLFALLAPQVIIDGVSAACHQAKLDVKRITASSLASAVAVLSGKDRENGAGVLDLGAKASTLVVYASGELDCIITVPWGGNILTERIAKRLGIDKAQAEEYKIAFVKGEIVSGLNISQATMIYKEVVVWIQRLCKFLERQLDIEFWVSKSQDSYSLSTHGGIVLTGGNSHLLDLPEILEELFNLPVRHGEIQGRLGLDEIPLEYTSAVGVVLCG